MKRVIFIVLWTVMFFVITFIAGMVSFGLFSFAGIESWKQSTIVFFGRSWSVMIFGVPVLGLVLGLFGKLPGTKRIRLVDSRIKDTEGC